MKNDAMLKLFPYNLFKDIGCDAPAGQAEDFLPTLMYILRCVSTPRDSKAILMRYKDGKSYEEIGEALGLSKQRAHFLIQEIVSKFTGDYMQMLQKGIKKYYEDLLIERINALGETIESSERDAIYMSAYEDGYEKGYTDGLEGMRASKASGNTLQTVTLDTLELSTRTFNALTHNRMRTLADVVDRGDRLMDIVSYGKNCFRETANTLELFGVNIERTFPNCVKKWGR